MNKYQVLGVKCKKVKTMLVRYNCFDGYPIPVKEEELLFNGTRRQCSLYLFKEWYVDFMEMSEEILNRALHDIKCIQVLDIEVKSGGKYIPVHELVDMDIYDELMGQSGWRSIDPTNYIFNKELIEVT